MADDRSRVPQGMRRRGGERRIITALFCDVAGSTSMAERLDPEEWVEIMNEAFDHMSMPISRYEGVVARLMGDGLLAFFGAPVGHEDDPRRAVLAGLGIIEALGPFREQIRREYGLDFNVRVGINTGPVVVGEMGSAAASEYTAMGDAVNVAARMEQTAAPGTVQISADTHRLVSNAFEFEPLGEIEVKGKQAPVASYRVIGVSQRPSIGSGSGVASAKLIGREAELVKLKTALDSTRQGHGHIVCIIGEAGLGKSRLLDELHRMWLEVNSNGEWEQSAGVPYDQSRPYALFQSMARGSFDIRMDDTPEIIHRKVDQVMRAGGASEESVALCSVTMERVIAAKVLHEAPEFPAEAIKKDLYDVAYPAWMSAAESTPMAAVFDDLQWADEASVDLLIHLLDSADEAPILFVCAFRPEPQSVAWRVKQAIERSHSHRYTEIVLEPLDRSNTEHLINALLDIPHLPNDLRSLILRKTEGNPYFVEEVVRSLIEQGVVSRTSEGVRWNRPAGMGDIAIPDSLQALLIARIDRLETLTRETLQLASVMGRTFYQRVLKEISDSSLQLDEHLRSLEKVELIREQEQVPELEYIFRHELARDAAYSTILHRRRREVHRRVAEAMESLFSGKLEEYAHRLAYHFEEGGDDEKALRYYEMAAESAEGLHANSEAVSAYTRALKSARRLGAPEARLSLIESNLDQAVAALHAGT